MSISTPNPSDLQPEATDFYSGPFNLEGCRLHSYEILHAEYLTELNATISVLRIYDKHGKPFRLAFELIPDNSNLTSYFLASHYRFHDFKTLCALDFEYTATKSKFNLVHRIVDKSIRSKGIGLGTSFFSYAQSFLASIYPQLTRLEMQVRQLSVLNFALKNGFEMYSLQDQDKIDLVRQMQTEETDRLSLVGLPKFGKDNDPYLVFKNKYDELCDDPFEGLLFINLIKNVSNPNSIDRAALDKLLKDFRLRLSLAALI